MSNFKNKIRRSVIAAQAALERAKAYSSVLNSLGNSPGLHNYVAATTNIASLALKHAQEKHLSLKCFSYLGGTDGVLEVITEEGILLGKKERQSTVDLYGVIIYSDSGTPSLFELDKDTSLDQANKAIAKAIWNNSKGKVISLRNAANTKGDVGKIWSLECNPWIDVHDSNYADKIIEGIRRFAEKGLNRSILLYGSPGTGKTVVAHRVCRDVSRRTIILECSSYLTTDFVIRVCEQLAPEAVILNEIDKVFSDRILEAIEYLNKKVKLVIATANYRDSMSPALLRPGRFDEILNVENVDNLVYQKMINFPTNPAMEAEMKSWPVAFLAELCKRYTIDPERLEENYLDIKSRIDFNKKDINNANK